MTVANLLDIFDPLPQTLEKAPPRRVPPIEKWQAAVVATEQNQTRRSLLRQMLETCSEWNLLNAGDRILVALSGGKDSYTLFDLLWYVARRAPFRIEVVGVHLDQVQPGYDGSPFYKWLKDFGAPYEIIREDTYSVVAEKTRPGQAYCVICSRLRRGILYDAAERLGCNKLALGHHRDDGLETLLLNMFFAGKMQAMPASYTTDDGRFQVIRPLIDTAESEIAAHAAIAGYPILPCNLCGSQDGLKREEMKALLQNLESRFPDVRRVMHHSIKNIRPTHLLDDDIRRAWAARDETIRPDTPARTPSEAVKKKPLVILSSQKKEWPQKGSP